MSQLTDCRLCSVQEAKNLIIRYFETRETPARYFCCFTWKEDEKPYGLYKVTVIHEDGSTSLVKANTSINEVEVLERFTC